MARGLRGLRAIGVLLLTLGILVSLPGGLARTEAARVPDHATWHLAAQIPVGPEGVQYQLDRPGGADRGPEAIAASTDGTVYLLHSVNREILEVRNGSTVRRLGLPSTSYPLDMHASSEGLYVLDDTDKIIKVTWAGATLAEYELPQGMHAHQVYRLATQDTHTVLWAQNYHEFDVEALPPSVDLDGYLNTSKQVGPGITSPDGRRWVGQFAGPTEGILRDLATDREIRIRAHGVLGSARLVGFDAAGHIYMLVEDLFDEKGSPRVELSLHKYSPNGSLAAVARFPDDFVFVPRKPVEVSPSGTVYVMLPRANTVDLYTVVMGQSSPRKAHRPLPRPEPLHQAGGDIGILALSRKGVYDRAAAMTTVSWTWRSAYEWFNGEWFSDRQDRTRPSDAPRPLQLAALSDGSSVSGIPYYWGGFDSQWTKSDWAGSRWSSWSGALSYYINMGKRGPLVGDTDSLCGVYPDNCWSNSGTYAGGAGIDCSGYVAAASGNSYTAKPGTGQLATAGYDWKGSDSITASLWRLQPMNFLVKSGHTLYYVQTA